MDQNLVTGATFGGGNEVAFAAIADVLRQIVCPESGPYGLVLWAEEPSLGQLKTFLFERLTGEDAKLLPVFMTVLQKGEYIDTGSGDVKDPEKLKSDLNDRISSNPQMKALLSWEADVFAATDAVLRSIVGLVPVDIRASNEFGSELGKVLYRLSQAGAGADRALENPREAINRVLVPILADRVTEHDPEGDAGEAWTNALVEVDNPKEPAPLKVQAAVNTSIHLSFARTPNSAPIKATDLGAVLELPESDSNALLQEVFGVTEKKLRGELFRADRNDWRNCVLRLVQIGAACDHAQPKPGPLLYLLGIEWCFANEDGSESQEMPTMWLGNREKFGRARPFRDSEWQSPIIQVPHFGRPGKLSIFKNLTWSVRPDATEGWRPIYRLREEIVSELTQEYARYISRPGIVTLR